MIVVISCIDSTVVIVVWCPRPAMASRAVTGDGARVGGSAGARAEPEQPEHKPKNTQQGEGERENEESKQR